MKESRISLQSLQIALKQYNILNLEWSIYLIFESGLISYTLYVEYCMRVGIRRNSPTNRSGPVLRLICFDYELYVINISDVTILSSKLRRCQAELWILILVQMTNNLPWKLGRYWIFINHTCICSPGSFFLDLPL